MTNKEYSESSEDSSYSIDSSLLFHENSHNERNRIQHKIEKEYKRKYKPRPFNLSNLIPLLTRSVKVIVKDDISQCFESNLESHWNWNPYLYVMWSLGVLFRYFVLFPIRVFVLVVGTIVFFIRFLFAFRKGLSHVERIQIFRKLTHFYAGIIVFTWGSIIKRHGTVQTKRPNQIYVANHTSMIDYILLLRTAPFAVLAQSYGGWLGFIQNKVLKNLVGGVWFERLLPNDRKRCVQLICDYISSEKYSTNRLLIFPEGTCVNNRYCIQFKRSAFELAEEVCPIAIKYNDSFVDAYWNSRKKSFFRHILDLMTSWTLVVDIHFLEPQTKKPGETSEEFSARVKELICKRIGLKSKNWNGYLKHLRPSSKFVEMRQKKFAAAIKKQLECDFKIKN